MHPKTGTTHLFIDGWLSAGNDEAHVATLYRDYVARHDPNLLPRVRAFSYHQPELTYSKFDTMGPVATHIQNLMDVITAAPRATWVVTAYSLGAAVATIALGRLSAQLPTLRTRVPLLILWAPAFYGGEAVLDVVQQDPALLKGGVPPPIAIDLALREGRLPREARQAVTSLLDAGIAVAIMYSQHDQFAPYTPLETLRVLHQERSAAADEKEKGRRQVAVVDPFLIHVRMRNDHAVQTLTYHLAKPLVSTVRQEAPGPQADADLA